MYVAPSGESEYEKESAEKIKGETLALTSREAYLLNLHCLRGREEAKPGMEIV